MKTQVLKSGTAAVFPNEHFTYSFKSFKSAQEIYHLLLQVKKWWSGFYEETITGKSEELGDEFEFLAGGGVHYSKHRLVELIPGKKIVWEVTKSKLTFISIPEEWIGTKLRFDISDDGDNRLVTFTHEGLGPRFECYGNCSGAWTEYMEQLKDKMNN